MALFMRGSNSLVAYFDESMSPGNLPITAVAGYLFERAAYNDFDAEMCKLLKKHNLKYYRMSECVHLNNEFNKFRNLNSSAPLEIETQVIRLIREYAVIGVCGAVSEAQYSILQPMLMEELAGSVYSMLCQWCLAEIGKWADREHFDGEIDYFFEDGCAHQTVAHRALGKLPQYPDLTSQYRYHSHAFINKVAQRGLQAADMLAWFGRREAEEEADRLSGKAARNRRKDFQALIGNSEAELGQIKHYFKYFDSASLMSLLSDDQNTDPALRWHPADPT